MAWPGLACSRALPPVPQPQPQPQARAQPQPLPRVGHQPSSTTQEQTTRLPLGVLTSIFNLSPSRVQLHFRINIDPGPDLFSASRLP